MSLSMASPVVGFRRAVNQTVLVSHQGQLVHQGPMVGLDPLESFLPVLRLADVVFLDQYVFYMSILYHGSMKRICSYVVFIPVRMFEMKSHFKVYKSRYNGCEGAVN